MLPWLEGGQQALLVVVVVLLMTMIQLPALNRLRQLLLLELDGRFRFSALERRSTYYIVMGMEGEDGVCAYYGMDPFSLT